MATIQNPVELTLYLVGSDEDNALENLVFDSFESAESFALDQDEFVNIYSVSAYVDPSTIEKEEWPIQ